MGDNNIVRGKVTSVDGDRIVIEDEHGVTARAEASAGTYAVGDPALAAVRAAAVELADDGSDGGVNSADCEIVFVEFLGDLVKLHLTAGGDRMLAKVSGDRYGSLRGREGERIRIRWKDEDVQLLRP
jgi:hypothetical protein